MSRYYKKSSDIPNDVLADRLKELSDAVVARMHRDESKFLNEFTFRIPCELDRDADVVLAEAAKRMRGLNDE